MSKRIHNRWNNISADFKRCLAGYGYLPYDAALNLLKADKRIPQYRRDGLTRKHVAKTLWNMKYRGDAESKEEHGVVKFKVESLANPIQLRKTPEHFNASSVTAKIVIDGSFGYFKITIDQARDLMKALTDLGIDK